jgi:hypothetical protein
MFCPRKLVFKVILALAVAAGPAAFGIDHRDRDRDHDRREHRHITGMAMNDIGFLAALASGVGSYLLVRRRALRK